MSEEVNTFYRNRVKPFMGVLYVGLSEKKDKEFVEITLNSSSSSVLPTSSFRKQHSSSLVGEQQDRLNMLHC